jgi:hypothetical protein
MKHIIIFTFFLILNSAAICQAPPIQWQKCYNYPFGYIFKTNNSDYIITGSIPTFFRDGLLRRIDTLGNIIWEKIYGGYHNDDLIFVNATNDGGFIAIGATESSNILGYHGPDLRDAWIIKLDSVGNMQWQKAFGGTNVDYASIIKQTKDGGYIVGGYTKSSNGDVSINKGGADFWLFKIDSLGVMQWQKTYGGNNDDNLSGLDITADNGYVLTGGTYSVNGDISLNKGQDDVWVVKVDSLGNIQWQKTYGGNQSERSRTILQTPDKGFIVAGTTNTVNNGDVLNVTQANYNYWVFQTDSLGVLQWQKTYGGESYEDANQMIATIDGGYAIIGTTASAGGDVSGNHIGGGTPEDYWLIKIYNSGNLHWQKCLGGVYAENGYSLLQTNTGSYMVAGKKNGGNSGDVSCTSGGDVWVVRLAATSPLPLKFINYYIISKHEKSVENIWTTANEINVSYFNIQRSNNNKDFYTLQKVIAKNKTNNEYSYLDNQPILGDNYYRIESVDKDGKISYSETKKIAINNSSSNINIYPNPAKDIINIESINASQIIILDGFGRIVKQVNNVSEHQTINLKQYNKGIYFIKIVLKNLEVKTEKIIVQ